jgi:putative membrane protein
MNLRAMYSTQLRVLWEWRGGRRALLKRLIVTLVVSAIAFYVTAWLMPSITIDRFLDGVFVVVLMALLNAVIRPAVLALVAPRSLILTGIAVLLLQVLVFLVAANLVPGVHVGGLLSGLIGSFIYAIINTALTAILGIDSGDSVYGLLIQNLLLKGAAAKTDQPGLVIVQIDGLAYPILAGRIRAGSVNTGSATARTSCRAGRRSCRP